MPTTTPSRRRIRKPARQYHHGDLRRALLEEAVRTIHSDGVAGLTLRTIGARLGVSRAALYRHFADKNALLAAVAAEGFRTLRLEIAATFPDDRQTRDAFADMAVAYVSFAVKHPSHYRVMFGGFVAGNETSPELVEEGTGAFNVLVNAIVALQRRGELRADEPLPMAQFVWATVHGMAMLAIDGQLRFKSPAEIETFTRYAATRLMSGTAVAPA